MMFDVINSSEWRESVTVKYLKLTDLQPYFRGINDSFVIPVL